MNYFEIYLEYSGCSDLSNTDMLFEKTFIHWEWLGFTKCFVLSEKSYAEHDLCRKHLWNVDWFWLFVGSFSESLDVYIKNCYLVPQLSSSFI